MTLSPFLFITVVEGRTPKSVSPVRTPLRVFLPPDKGMRLIFIPVSCANTKIPSEAG